MMEINRMSTARPGLEPESTRAGRTTRLWRSPIHKNHQRIEKRCLSLENIEHSWQRFTSRAGSRPSHLDPATARALKAITVVPLQESYGARTDTSQTAPRRGPACETGQ